MGDLKNALKGKIGVRSTVKRGMCQASGASPKRWTLGDYLARTYLAFLAIVALVSTVLGKTHAKFLRKHGGLLRGPKE